MSNNASSNFSSYITTTGGFKGVVASFAMIKSSLA
jgi:hypothetical protein